MQQTLEEFNGVIQQCRSLFVAKTKDYGTAWRILRTRSITDQLYIKALRIRSIEEKGAQKVGDSIASEFIGLVNYSILALIQMELPPDAPMELSVTDATRRYDTHVAENIRLLQAKNHDYGEAWRLMRVSRIPFVNQALYTINHTLKYDFIAIVADHFCYYWRHFNLSNT
jgi:Nucleotide modification associated domain 1